MLNKPQVKAKTIDKCDGGVNNFVEKNWPSVEKKIRKKSKKLVKSRKSTLKAQPDKSLKGKNIMLNRVQNASNRKKWE